MMTPRLASALLAGALLLSGGTLSSALADPGGPPPRAMRHTPDQDAARKALLDGAVMPFSLIKRRVERQMGDDADYLGSEFIPSRNAYRLKFMRDRNVVWVDVDGRTGDITGWAR